MNDYEILNRIGKGYSLIDMPMNYTVIDLETTGLSPRYDKIIEVAAVRIRDGQPVEEFQQLVHPELPIPEYISAITHITDEMVADAPTISDVLPKYLEFLGDDVIVGHNVSFDINFIFDREVALYDTPFANNYINTVRLAKRIVEIPRYRLCDLCAYFAIQSDNAHRALADCRMTHELMCKLRDYCEKSDITLADIQWMPEHKGPSRTHHHVDARLIECKIPPEEIDKNNPLYGKHIVFTGALIKYKRETAMQIVANMGGINQNSVTKETDYLVLGNNDYCKSIKGGKSTKQKKAEAYMVKGTGISIMDEQTFYDMVSDTEY